MKTVYGERVPPKVHLLSLEDKFHLGQMQATQFDIHDEQGRTEPHIRTFSVLYIPLPSIVVIAFAPLYTNTEVGKSCDV